MNPPWSSSLSNHFLFFLSIFFSPRQRKKILNKCNILLDNIISLVNEEGRVQIGRLTLLSQSPFTSVPEGHFLIPKGPREHHVKKNCPKILCNIKYK